MPKPARKPDATDNDSDTPLLEWIFGALGLALFAGALAITLINGLSPDTPPTISVAAEAPQATSEGFRVEFEARNGGDETAALVRLVATVKDGDAIVETQTVEIDFLPPHSSRRAGVFLQHDPAGLAVAIRAVSYQHP